MVKDFIRRGVPIDGIGLQMHILDLNPDVESIAKNIARFGKLGIQVQFTEMDVAIPVNKTAIPPIPKIWLNRPRSIAKSRRFAPRILHAPPCRRGALPINTHGSAGTPTILKVTHYCLIAITSLSPLTKPYARCWYIRLPPEAPGNPNDCGSPELQYALPSRTLNPRCGL